MVDAGKKETPKMIQTIEETAEEKGKPLRRIIMNHKTRVKVDRREQ